MPIHALRHTFGTVMARRVPLGVLQRLMGHSEVTTTMRYVDVSEDDKREAITAVFGALGQQVGNRGRAAREFVEIHNVDGESQNEPRSGLPDHTARCATLQHRWRHWAVPRGDT